MDWFNLLGKGLFSGAVIVAASEIAKKSTIFGALVIPSMVLFLVLPQLLRRNWEFESAMAVGILMTILAYFAGIGLAKYFGSVS